MLQEQVVAFIKFVAFGQTEVRTKELRNSTAIKPVSMQASFTARLDKTIYT